MNNNIINKTSQITTTNRNQNETANDLFARLISTNNSTQQSSTNNASQLSQIESILMVNKQFNIDSALFPNGIENKQIYEIYGRPLSGKTELIMHLMSRLLIPSKWKFELNNQTFELNLNEISSALTSSLKVILIETELKFSELRIFTIIENRFIECYKKASALPNYNEIIKILMHKFIKECLKNLIIFKCDSNEQYILGISACDHYLNSLNQNKMITPIFIDTINSNYEIIDKYNHLLDTNSNNDMNFTENYAIILLKRLIENHNVCLIVARSEFINHISSNNSDLSNNKFYLDYFFNSFQKWQKLVNKRIELNVDKRLISIYSLNSEKTLVLDKTSYSINNNGFNLNN